MDSRIAAHIWLYLKTSRTLSLKKLTKSAVPNLAYESIVGHAMRVLLAHEMGLGWCIT